VEGGQQKSSERVIAAAGAREDDLGSPLAPQRPYAPMPRPSA